MSIHADNKNMFVENIVIDYRDRPNGSESKLNPYSDGINVLRTIVRLYTTYKSKGFFGLIALLLTIISSAVFCTYSFWLILSEYINTGLVSNSPTLIVCGFTIIVAIQLLFTGLTLQTFVQKKVDFEINLHRVSKEKRKEQQGKCL